MLYTPLAPSASAAAPAGGGGIWTLEQTDVISGNTSAVVKEMLPNRSYRVTGRLEHTTNTVSTRFGVAASLTTTPIANALQYVGRGSKGGDTSAKTFMGGGPTTLWGSSSSSDIQLFELLAMNQEPGNLVDKWAMDGTILSLRGGSDYQFQDEFQIVTNGDGNGHFLVIDLGTASSGYIHWEILNET